MHFSGGHTLGGFAAADSVAVRGCPTDQREKRNGAHRPKQIGVKADKRLARAVVAHGELVGAGGEILRAQLITLLVDANNQEDGASPLVVHCSASLRALRRLGEPNRRSQQRRENEHQNGKRFNWENQRIISDYSSISDAGQGG